MGCHQVTPSDPAPAPVSHPGPSAVKWTAAEYAGEPRCLKIVSKLFFLLYIAQLSKVARLTFCHSMGVSSVVEVKTNRDPYRS